MVAANVVSYYCTGGVSLAVILIIFDPTLRTIPSQVLSAAHCLGRLGGIDPPNTIYASLGMHWKILKHSSNATEFEHLEHIPIVEQVLHPEYKGDKIGGKGGNDFALFRLAWATQLYQSDIVELDAPTNDEFDLDVGKQSHKLDTIGFGDRSQGKGKFTNVLQEVNVTYISNADCVADYAYTDKIKPSMLCAGVPGGGQDACKVRFNQCTGTMISEHHLSAKVRFLPTHRGTLEGQLVSWFVMSLNRWG